MPSPKCCSPLRRCPQSGRDVLARALPGQALQGSRCQKVLLGPGLNSPQRFEPDAKGPCRFCPEGAPKGPCRFCPEGHRRRRCPLSAPSQAALALDFAEGEAKGPCRFCPEGAPKGPDRFCPEGAPKGPCLYPRSFCTPKRLAPSSPASRDLEPTGCLI